MYVIEYSSPHHETRRSFLCIDSKNEKHVKKEKERKFFFFISRRKESLFKDTFAL